MLQSNVRSNVRVIMTLAVVILTLSAVGVLGSINESNAAPSVQNTIAQPGLSVSDVSVMEGDSGTIDAVFTISLTDGPASGNVTATAVTVTATASGGSDFEDVVRPLVFAPGETTKTVAVHVYGDLVYEGNEVLNLELRDVVNSTVGDGIGVGTIVENEPFPTLTVSDVTIIEGDAPSAVFTVSISSLTKVQVSFELHSASGSALEQEDFSGVGGARGIGFGRLQTTVTVPIIDDTISESDEHFFLNISNANGATIIRSQGVCTIKDDDMVTSAPTVQFIALEHSVSEGAADLQLTMTRSGGSSHSASVDYGTIDYDPFLFNCAETGNAQAFGRCDFTTSVGTVTFAPGETEKTISIPIIDDAYVEKAERFFVQLSNPVGATVGTPSMANVTIQDNDFTGESNPIFNTPFFVRQHYLDFLSREPEASGFDAWVNVLNSCSDVNNDPVCDRVVVSASFFGSPEFQLKGFYVFRFYKLAFNRLPQYAEIIPDMSFVAGSTPQEVYDRKARLAVNFSHRQQFLDRYGALSNTDYVGTLLSRYQLSQLTTPDPINPDGVNKVKLTGADLVSKLDNNSLTRAQVFRAVADSDEVSSAEFNSAFVAMQYYGYLRRTPDNAGYDAWLAYLNSHPSDFRTMVNGFMNSIEYRLRFGASN